ncbi:hypothetical protein [Halopseudomonas salegens]|nr:hypothetical protein [Halopseudomonas salegens]
MNILAAERQMVVIFDLAAALFKQGKHRFAESIALGHCRSMRSVRVWLDY